MNIIKIIVHDYRMYPCIFSCHLLSVLPKLIDILYAGTLSTLLPVLVCCIQLVSLLIKVL